MAGAAAEMAGEIRLLEPVEQGKLLRMLLNDLNGRADFDVAQAMSIGEKDSIAPSPDEILAMAAASLADVPATDLRSLTQRLVEPEG